MYGCFDGAVVYGVTEESREKMVDPAWLVEHHPKIGTFAADVVRNYLGNAVYGVVCQMCPETGRAHVTDEERAAVDALAKALKDKAKFCLVVYGDYESSQHELYRP